METAEQHLLLPKKSNRKKFRSRCFRSRFRCATRRSRARLRSRLVRRKPLNRDLCRKPISARLPRHWVARCRSFRARPQQERRRRYQLHSLTFSGKERSLPLLWLPRCRRETKCFHFPASRECHLPRPPLHREAQMRMPFLVRRASCPRLQSQPVQWQFYLTRKEAHPPPRRQCCRR